MSGLKNTFKRAKSLTMGQGWTTSAERHQKRTIKRKAALDEIYSNAEMPDDELIKRNERRKAAKRRGSRVSTILTNDDGLGG